GGGRTRREAALRPPGRARAAPAAAALGGARVGAASRALKAEGRSSHSLVIGPGSPEGREPDDQFCAPPTPRRRSWKSGGFSTICENRTTVTVSSSATSRP